MKRDYFIISVSDWIGCSFLCAERTIPSFLYPISWPSFYSSFWLSCSLSFNINHSTWTPEYYWASQRTIYHRISLYFCKVKYVQNTMTPTPVTHGSSSFHLLMHPQICIRRMKLFSSKHTRSRGLTISCWTTPNPWLILRIRRFSKAS